jgi:hypothetical protein
VCVGVCVCVCVCVGGCVCVCARKHVCGWHIFGYYTIVFFLSLAMLLHSWTCNVLKHMGAQKDRPLIFARMHKKHIGKQRLSLSPSACLVTITMEIISINFSIAYSRWICWLNLVVIKLPCVVTPCNFLDVYPRFITTSWFILQASYGARNCSETLLHTFRNSRGHIEEDRDFIISVLRNSDLEFSLVRIGPTWH